MKYKAPIEDMIFVREKVFSFSKHYTELGFDDLSAETCEAILNEAAKFAENEIAPLNRNGAEA